MKPLQLFATLVLGATACAIECANRSLSFISCRGTIDALHQVELMTPTWRLR